MTETVSVPKSKFVNITGNYYFTLPSTRVADEDFDLPVYSHGLAALAPVPIEALPVHRADDVEYPQKLLHSLCTSVGYPEAA